MAKRTSGEQARLEHSLAQLHRAAWTIANLYHLGDEYEAADEMQEVARHAWALLEHELKRGRRLKTRSAIRAYPYSGGTRGDAPSA